MALAVALTVVTITAAVVTAILVSSTPRSSPSPPPRLVTYQLSQPQVKYAGPWVWYNITVLAVPPNITWNRTVIYFDPVPLWEPGINATITVTNVTDGPGVALSPLSQNWTTASPLPVAKGQIIVVKVDKPLMSGELAIWSTEAPQVVFAIGLP